MVENGLAQGFWMIRSKNPWKYLWRSSWIFQIFWNKKNRMSSLGSRIFSAKFDKMQHPKQTENHLWSKMVWRKGFGWSDQKILENVSGGPLESSKLFGIKTIAWVVLALEFFAQNSTKCNTQNEIKITYGRKWPGARVLDDQIKKSFKMSLEDLLNLPKLLESSESHE